MDIELFRDDIEQLEPVGKRWIAEAGGFGVDIDLAYTLRCLSMMIESENGAVLALRSKEGRVLGVMGLMRLPSSIGKDILCNEHLFYIEPEHRGRPAFEMVARAEQWGGEKGCQFLVMNASRLASGLHDRVCRMYERMGFKHFETVFIKRL